MDYEKVFMLATAAKELRGYPNLKPLLDAVVAELEAMVPQPEFSKPVEEPVKEPELGPEKAEQAESERMRR